MTAREILDRLGKGYRNYLDGDVKPVEGWDDTFYNGVLWAYARLTEVQPSDDSEVIDMKARITRTSSWDWEDKKTFKTLEELQDFIKENGNQVVVTFWKRTNTWEVEIYDTYRE